jgi:hypothetical protein
MLETMRTSVLACALAAAVGACGGNANGSAAGENGLAPSPGSDNGAASDNPTNAGSDHHPNGSTGATSGPRAPLTCGPFGACPTGEDCSPLGGNGIGLCIERCTLPTDVLVGKSGCPDSEICVRAQTEGNGVCKIPCTKDSDCPDVVGLVTSCVSIGTGGPSDVRICNWSVQAMPGGTR